MAKDVTVYVAVIGGGIADISAALLLKQAGVKVAVIEAKNYGRPPFRAGIG
jgi:2-polyprenyl-6-methoxyphenol hydroxylase-like FAD-dependent oxidoreductase